MHGATIGTSTPCIYPFSPSFLFFLPPFSTTMFLTRPVSPVWAVGSSAALTGFMESPGGVSLGLERPLGLRLKEFGASQSCRSFCPGVLSPPSYPARFSFPLCVLQAAQPFRNPSEKLPRSPLCLSSDQVLRILAKNEKQLSLLRDLEGLKPQKVRNLLGLGPCPLLPHSGLHPRLPVPFPPPQTWPSGCACWR